jgi:PTH1 family peptidyl-tRNA hydrolase
MGVGSPPHKDYDMADWVLGSFRNQDAEDIAKAAESAADAIEVFFRDGAEKAMNKFN